MQVEKFGMWPLAVLINGVGAWMGFFLSLWAFHRNKRSGRNNQVTLFTRWLPQKGKNFLWFSNIMRSERPKTWITGNSAHLSAGFRWSDFFVSAAKPGTRSRDIRSRFSPQPRRSRSWVSTTEKKHLRGKSNWAILQADRATGQLGILDVLFTNCKNLSQI